MKTKEFKYWERQTKFSWLEEVKKTNPNIGNLEYFKINDERIIAKSFAFPTDLVNEGHVFKSMGEACFCKVGIKLQNEDISILKSNLQLALENGAEYIYLVLPKNTNTKIFQSLIENVYLDMLVTRWIFPTSDIMKSCQHLINQKYDKVNAFFEYTNSPNLENRFSENQTLVYKFSSYDTSSWVKILANMLNEFASGIQSFNKIILEIKINNNFLLNVCSIRALKLVLNKIWKIFDLKCELFYEANIDEQAIDQDVHSNIYKLAAMALSASISGVDFLILPSADIHNREFDIQWLKTSLHTQHILKQEALLSKLSDPTAGSYFIEDLTEQISEKLWLDLQENLRHD